MKKHVFSVLSTRRSLFGLVVAAGLGIAACVPTVSKDATLYERLGALPAITAVVDKFIGNVAADTRINHYFAKTDIPKLKKNLVDQICEATGGPCRYTGRSMLASHKGLGISDGEFNAMGEDLAAALDELNVPEREQGELLSAIGAMKGEIVNQ